MKEIIQEPDHSLTETKKSQGSSPNFGLNRRWVVGGCLAACIVPLSAILLTIIAPTLSFDGKASVFLFLVAAFCVLIWRMNELTRRNADRERLTGNADRERLTGQEKEIEDQQDK